MKIILGAKAEKLIAVRKKLAETISIICNADGDTIDISEIATPLIDLECLLDDFSGIFEEETR